MGFGPIDNGRVVWGCGVYEIASGTTGQFYVGSSLRVMRRLTQHQELLEAGKHPNPRLQAEFNLGHTLSVSVMATKDRTTAYAEEQKILDLCFGGLYCLNISSVANGNAYTRRVLKLTEKTKLSRKGIPQSRETRLKISWSLQGRTASRETREKMKESKRKPFYVKGVLYPDLQVAAKALGISAGTVRARLRDPQYPQFAYANNISKKSSSLDI